LLGSRARSLYRAQPVSSRNKYLLEVGDFSQYQVRGAKVGWRLGHLGYGTIGDMRELSTRSACYQGCAPLTWPLLEVQSLPGLPLIPPLDARNHRSLSRDRPRTRRCEQRSGLLARPGQRSGGPEPAARWWPPQPLSAADPRIKPTRPRRSQREQATVSIDVRAAISPSVRTSDTCGGFADRRGEMSGAAPSGHIEVPQSQASPEPGRRSARRGPQTSSPGRPGR